MQYIQNCLCSYIQYVIPIIFIQEVFNTRSNLLWVLYRIQFCISIQFKKLVVMYSFDMPPSIAT